MTQNSDFNGGSAIELDQLNEALDGIEQALADLENINMKMSVLTVALADRVARTCGPLPLDKRVELVAGVHSLLAKSIESSTVRHAGSEALQ